MVFGWGKKKESTEQINKDAQNHTIALSEIESVLQKQKQTKQQLVLQQTKPRFEQIQKEMLSIAKIISHLESDDLKVDDIDKTLKVLVKRSKSEVIEIVSKESQKILPQITSYDDVVRASEIASYVLKKIGDVLGKHSRVIHVFAKKYAQDLKTHLEAITANAHAISKQIHEVSSIDSSSTTIKNAAEKIIHLNNEINEKKQHLKKLQESQNESTDTIRQTEQKIAAMCSSPAHSKYLECLQQIKHVESQRNKIHKEIDDEFSKISRPLGKYVYVTSLEKPHKLVLEKLIANHADTISSENRDSIVTILESCMKGIMSGTVSVKETDKSVDQITGLISSLDDFIARKNTVNSQIFALQNNLTTFDSKQLDDLEKQLARAKLDKEDSESKIAKLQSELDQDDSQLQTLLSDLQNSLEKISGIKYTLGIE